MEMTFQSFLLGISAASLQSKNSREVGGAQPPPPRANFSKLNFCFSSLYPPNTSGFRLQKTFNL